MMNLDQLDAVAQAEAVRRGDVSPLELVDATIERIERVNPQLNAVIMKRYDEARAEASGDLPDGPLRGVPFLLKDIGATQAGTPNHFSNRALKAAGNISEVDTVLGARFRAAGLITLGKNQFARTRYSARQPIIGLWPRAESLEPRLFALWVVRWRSIGRGIWHDSGCSCQRWRRFNAFARRLERSDWA